MEYQYQSLQISSSKNISTVKNELRVDFPIPFQLPPDTYVALEKAFIYYSWFNITSAFNNNRFQYKWIDGNTYDIVLADGFYTVADLNSYLRLRMVENKHYLVDDIGQNIYYISLQENATYYAITLQVDPLPTSLPTGWTKPSTAWSLPVSAVAPQLTILGANDFYKIIGFTPATYPPTSSTITYQRNSDLVPISHPIQTVSINTNFVSNNTLGGLNQSLSTFTADVVFGSQIVVEPNQYSFLQASSGQKSFISITFTDQDDRAINIIDRNSIVIRLVLRMPIKSR